MTKKYKTFKFKITFYDFLIELANSHDAREKFIQTIISSGYDNCYLEFPALSKKTYQNNAEFTITESEPFPKADWKPFENQLKPLIGSKSSVTSFDNLTNDTQLVVPIPINNFTDTYSNHLINFLKHGQKTQQHGLIKLFASNALELAENNKKVYISTHGHGVPWLHIRLAESPKYYQHADYVSESQWYTQNVNSIWIAGIVIIAVIACCIFYKS